MCNRMSPTDTGVNGSQVKPSSRENGFTRLRRKIREPDMENEIFERTAAYSAREASPKRSVHGSVAS